MKLVCLDLEGILMPEIWLNVAKKTKIRELELTTRDVPDYDFLMKRRLKILKDNKIRLKNIQKIIKNLKPLKGALNFPIAKNYSELKSKLQLLIDKTLTTNSNHFTPLVKSKRIGDELGIDLCFKLDSETALTRSFKDRPVAMAFNRAIEAGYTTSYVASTGNLAIATAYFAKEYNLNGR